MMSLKPLAVVVVAVAVAGVAVVRMRAPENPGQTSSLAPTGQSNGGAAQPPQQTNAPRIPNVVGNSGPTQNGDRLGEKDGHNSNGTNGTRTRVIGHRQDRVKNGSYITTIAGFYSGSGTAEVKDDRVSIKADVHASDGRSGQLVASNLMVDGPYFFGVGTVLGDTVQVTGRVDAARASRLIATFSNGDGRAARVVGNLPAALDAGDDNWDAGVREPR